MPVLIYSVLLKMWSLFLKLSCRMKSSEIIQKGREEDLHSSLYSDHLGLVTGTQGK